MLFNKYFTTVFIDAPMCKQCQQCEKKKQCKIRRKIAPTISDDLFFLQKPGSRDAVEQSCNRLTISLHHNNSKSSGTQSSKVTCVDYLMFVCLISKENKSLIVFRFLKPLVACRSRKIVLSFHNKQTWCQ